MDFKNLKLNIDNDDYFGTLATRLDIIKQEIIRNKITNIIQAEMAQKLVRAVEELNYLQANAKIIWKTKN